MRLTNRQADRLQRALEGERVTDAQIAAFLETARALSSAHAVTPAPRQEFVDALRLRLMAEAQAMPARSPASVTTAHRQAASRRAASDQGPQPRAVVVLLGRGLPRLVAGATASVLAVGTVVGVVSREAIPGSALYPVKGWLDTVAVQLAGSAYDRGLTHLSQAQEHISDTRELSDQDAEPERFVESLDAASASVRSGHRELDAAFDETGSPQALLAMRDFTSRALPQVEALRSEVPAAALPALRRLQSLLQDAESSSVRRLAACAPSCVSLEELGAGPAVLPVLPSLSGGATATTPAGTTVGAVVVPDEPVTLPAPVDTAGDGGVVVGDQDAGVTVSTDGGAVTLPTVGVTVPDATVEVTLPSASVSTDGAGVTLPGATVSGVVTLPGLGVTLTSPTLLP